MLKANYAAYFICAPMPESSEEGGVTCALGQRPEVVRWETGALSDIDSTYLVRVFTASVEDMNILKADKSGLWEWIVDA